TDPRPPHAYPLSLHDALPIYKNAPLEAMFTFAVCLSWPGLELQMDVLPGWVPPRWIMELRDFYHVTNLAEWWQREDVVWQKSLRSEEHTSELQSRENLVCRLL